MSMKLDDIGRLCVTLNRDQKIVIDGVVEISISTHKNARVQKGQVSLLIEAPKEIKIDRKPKYPNSEAPKKGDV